MKKMLKCAIFTFVMATVLFLGDFEIVSAHTYYGNSISVEQAAQADAIAKDIANKIMFNSAYKTRFGQGGGGSWGGS